MQHVPPGSAPCPRHGACLRQRAGKTDSTQRECTQGQRLTVSAAWPGPSPRGALSESQVHPLLPSLPSVGAGAVSGRAGPVADAAEARRTGTKSRFPSSSGDRHPWLPFPGQFPSSAAACWPLCRAISQPHTRAVVWGLRRRCLGRGARVYDSTAAWLLETKSCVLRRLPR